jgi:hypothetical protein
VDANGDPIPSTQRDFLTGFYENVGPAVLILVVLAA